jgi:hypothetical protein
MSDIRIIRISMLQLLRYVVTYLENRSARYVVTYLENSLDDKMPLGKAKYNKNTPH